MKTDYVYETRVLVLLMITLTDRHILVSVMNICDFSVQALVKTLVSNVSLTRHWLMMEIRFYVSEISVGLEMIDKFNDQKNVHLVQVQTPPNERNV